jgi:DNA polymerase elongation subunit (family B)
MMTDPVIGLWDTEWSPAVTYTWTSRPKYLPNEMLIEDARLLCYGAKYRGKPTKVVDERIGRTEMLTQLRDFLDSVDMLVSFNGQNFDTPKVNSEFMREGIKPPSPFKEVDLYRVIRKNSSYYSGKLDFVAERIVGQKKVATGGFQLWRDVLAGDEKAWRKFRAYQKQDVDLLEELFDELRPWIRMPHPVTNTAGLVCRNCGSTHLQSRGVSRTLQGEYPRYQCVSCATWMKGTKRTPIGETRAI